MKPKLYLAHPFYERFYVRERLQPILEGQGIDIVNPFLDREHGKEIFFSNYEDSFLQVFSKEIKYSSPSDVVSLEMEMIKGCDGLFAYLPYASVGVGMEILYNSFYLKKGRDKTFVYTKDKNFLFHPWITTFAHIDDNLERLVYLIYLKYEER